MMLYLRRHRVVMAVLSALIAATALFCLTAASVAGGHGIVGASAAIATAPAPSDSTPPGGPPWG
jgi:F0F1-type ATP synthase membrane subunit c/vacuolar-type H+-ATPase subunit K